MLYLAQAFLLDRELSFSKHSAVIAAFGKEFVKTGVLPTEFHRYLIDAQEMRLIADYQGTQLDEKDAAMQIVRAGEFLQLAQKRLAE